jgi:hypothetical protein
MVAILALLAALVATGFLVRLASSYRSRPRPHLAAWTVAILMYAVATWALFAGLALGWSGPVFRVYFWLGAIVNVPVLAVGSIYLNFGRRAGHVSALVMLVAALATAWVVFTVGINPTPLQAGGVVRGSAVFDTRIPAILAGIFSPLGALLVVVLSLVAVLRFWNRNRSLAAGNLLIILAILALSVGGVKSTLYGGGLLAGTLLLGAALLWGGFAVASGARFRSWERPGGGPAPPGGPPTPPPEG